MHEKNTSLIFFLLTAYILFNTNSIMACHCPPMPTVLTSFEWSQNVIIAEITGVEKATTGESYQKGIKGMKVSVKKVFKGNRKEGDEVFVSQGGGSDCLWIFDEKSVGEKILIYDADQMFTSEKISRVWGCGRSKGTEHGSVDLLFLENLANLLGKTRIYGNIRFAYGRENPEGRKVRIVGKDKSYEVITDKDGDYEIYDLPAGEYSIEPEIPKGWRVEENLTRLMIIANDSQYPKAESPTKFPIILKEEKDASQDFFYVADNAIKGRVLDPSNKPMKEICVAAVDASNLTNDYLFGSCTDENGEFEINGLDPRSYVLVINGNGKIKPKQPIKTLFYPGVKNREEASVINIAEGENIILKDFKISDLLETITLSGILKYSNGTPVQKEKVEFIPDKKDEILVGDSYGNFIDYVEDDGSFLIKIFKGQTGRLQFGIDFEKRMLEKCPEIKKIIDESRNGIAVKVSDYSIEIKAAVEIKADRDLKDIKFAFPFPPCKKAY